MFKRRSYNWAELTAQFEQSGLRQTQFCKQHDLNAKRSFEVRVKTKTPAKGREQIRLIDCWSHAKFEAFDA